MILLELLKTIDLIGKKNDIPEVFICGGTPRDKYLTGNVKSIHDLDLCTGTDKAAFLGSEVFSVMRKTNNIQMKNHKAGQATIYFGNLHIDFSSHFVIRNIESYVGRKLSSLEQEMFSRDFGCNSLLASMDLKKIIDPTKRGISDLSDKIIRTCLKPEITLKAYPNRAVRSIYLAAKLGFELDSQLFAYIKANPSIVRNATVKSTNEKLYKAFEVNPEKSAKLITDMGLWNYLPVTDNMMPFIPKSTGKK
jgi:tRNA nucleotidyltransferase/poly(A) polymerase